MSWCAQSGLLEEHLLWEAATRAGMAGKLMMTLQHTSRGGTEGYTHALGLRLTEHAANSAPCLQPVLVLCKEIAVSQIRGRNRRQVALLFSSLHPKYCRASPGFLLQALGSPSPSLLEGVPRGQAQ